MDASTGDYFQNVTAARKTFDRPQAPHFVVASPEGAALIKQRVLGRRSESERPLHSVPAVHESLP